MIKTIVAIASVVILACVGIWYMSQPGQTDSALPIAKELLEQASLKVISEPQSIREESAQTGSSTGQLTNTNKNGMHTITIETTAGTIEIETYDSDAPNTVKNFTNLAGKGFYDNLIFHRVIKGFMIQGGDPLGNGTGGPGYTFADELDPTTQSYKSGYKKGVVAMANRGPDTNGSQFFIMHQDYPLPNAYTIFGKVIKGQDVVDAIANMPVGPNDLPKTQVVMKKVSVRENN